VPTSPTGLQAGHFGDRMAGYETASAIIWLILGIAQILLGLWLEPLLLLIGIWNIVAAVNRFNLIPRLRALDPAVPAEYEGLVGLIVFGVINLILGAVVGLVGIAVDFYLRDQVLKNRHLFTGDRTAIESEPLAAATAVNNNYNLLFKLGELRDRGVLSEDEFKAEKAKMLAKLSESDRF
jgi:hypothetical protein